MERVTRADRLKLGKWTWTVLLAGALFLVLMVEAAVAADPALTFLLKKGIITQAEYDEAIRDAERAPGGSQPPVVPDTSTGQPAAAKPPAASCIRARVTPFALASATELLACDGRPSA